jgi:hypothetical protein
MTRRTATQTIVQPLGGAERTSERLRQPNDRDESADDTASVDELAPAQRDHMERARRDVASGRRDTDCRSVPQAQGSPCAQPDDAGLVDDVIAPRDPTARDAENRRTAQHDPGSDAPAPDGSRR